MISKKDMVYDLILSKGKLYGDDEDVVSEAMFIDPSYIQFASIRLQSKFSNRIEIEGMYLYFVSPLTKEQKHDISHEFKRSLRSIDNSPISNFSEVLYGNIYIGTPDDVEKYGLSKIESYAGAYYSPSRDHVVVKLLDVKKMGDNLVHELSHRLHYRFMEDGYRNNDIQELFERATMSKTECVYSKMPSLGSPLTNILKGDRWWVTVKRSSNSEYYLKSIKDGNYIYQDQYGRFLTFSKQEIIKMIECPSSYGATDAVEFFAEMCTLITLRLVKPSQKRVAYEFMEVVKNNLK